LQPALVSVAASASASSFLACFNTTGVFSTSSFAYFNPNPIASLMTLMILILSAALTETSSTSNISLAFASTFFSVFASIYLQKTSYLYSAQDKLHEPQLILPVLLDKLLLQKIVAWINISFDHTRSDVV
jgi:hypothetical protein